MITISTCMIVKNEEAILRRCLSCVSQFSDEIIIVDTGSTDRTKAIAAEFTDKIYDFPWINDFAAARNYSFSKASCEYIYNADADEVIDEENIGKILELKQALLPEIDIVQMYYTNQLEFGTTYNYDKEYRPKLSKRLRPFIWQDPLHETLQLSPVIYDSDIAIIHKPHESHAKRDFENIQKVIAKNGRLSAKLNVMYAKELFISGDASDFAAAEPYYHSLENEVLAADELKACQCVLAKCAVLNMDAHALLSPALKNFAGGEASSEICYCLGEYYEAKEEYDEASMWYYNAAFETEAQLSIKHGHEYPIEALVRISKLQGNEEQAASYQDML